MSDPPPESVIEQAEFGDRGAVVRLFGGYQDGLGDTWDAGELGAVFDHMIDDKHMVLLVARDAESAQAVGVLVASRVLSVRFGGRSLWIEVLFVAPSARRRGLGRDLVEALIDLAADQGYRGIDLEAHHGNAAAGLLYRSLGFQRLGRERFSYDLAEEFETS